MRIKDAIILHGDIPDYLTQHGVHVRLAGKQYRCKCPLHDDARRNDAFSCNSKKWFCFEACEGGTIVELHMALHHVSYTTAIEQLADMYDIDLKNIKKQNHILHNKKNLFLLMKNLLINVLII